MDRAPVDDAQLRALVAEGLNPTTIAQRLGLPRSTVRDRLKKLGLPSSPDTSTEGIPSVYTDVVIGLIPALQEMAAWWEGRKASLAHASDATQETERMTFHVERRWIEAIRRQADLDGLTITQVVNKAFRQHFEGK
jgi:hypothetical protein